MQTFFPESNVNRDPKLKRNYKKYDNEEKTLRRISKLDHYVYQQHHDANINTILDLMKKGLLDIPLPDELLDANQETLQLWQYRNNLRIRGDQLYLLDKNQTYRYIVPSHKRQELILQTHLTIGHLGVEKTLTVLPKRFFGQI